MALNIHKSVYIKSTSILFLVSFLNAPSIAKISPVVELNQTSLYGRVHEWHKNIGTSHTLNIEVPNHAPIIISDYHSNVGANGLGRGGRHRGIDIFAKTGSPIIAAADGVIVRTKIDKCWGPTLLVKHGLDKNGKTFYALYGHVRNISARPGQRVRRGQQIAEMGEDIFNSCGAGIHHLHFQISYDPRYIPFFGWGWANFVMDGTSAPNPHKYWENGPGRITCYEKGKKYTPSGLTYPVPCTNKIIYPARPRFVKNKAHQSMLKRVVRLSSSEKTFANRLTLTYPNYQAENQIDYSRLVSSLDIVLAEEARK